MRARLETVFADIQMEPVGAQPPLESSFSTRSGRWRTSKWIAEAQTPLTSFFFNTTGPVNRLTHTGTLTLHFNEDDVLDALQRAYATEAEIIAALPSATAHYTITGVRLQARGPFSMTTWRSWV